MSRRALDVRSIIAALGDPPGLRMLEDRMKALASDLETHGHNRSQSEMLALRDDLRLIEVSLSRIQRVVAERIRSVGRGEHNGR